ncbi:MAG: Methionyl-tRNA synthetase, partial [uncultured Nocardioides sp.]
DPCPVRRRLAVRQRPAPHRPRRRFRRALRRLQPLHADGRPRRAHGERHGRARHADPGHRGPGGCLGQGPGRQEQRCHRHGPRGPRPVLRPLHPHHHRQPLRGRAGDVPHGAGQRLHGRADDPGRHQPVHRTHPARPLHRGHLSHLRVRRRAGRPVRQLRQPARRDRPHRAPVEDQRRDAAVRRHPALPARPAGAGGGPGGVAGRARGDRVLATQRHQVQPEHPQGDPAEGDDARHRLGHPGAGVGGPADQAALRVVRRCHRLPLGDHRVGSALGRPRGLAGVVERPGGAVLLLHGQGQHRLPRRDLAGRAAGAQRRGLPRRRAGPVRAPQPADRGRLLGVPHDGRPAVLHVARPRALRRRLPRPLRPRPAAL